MDANVFSASYQTGIQRTINFLISRGVPPDQSQDIAQSAWVRGWAYRHQLREPSTVVSWVNTIALNLFRRSLRSRAREEELTAAHLAFRSTRINEASIDVNRILDACEPKDRSLLEAQLAGRTPQELAEDHGVSPLAIRLRLMRARRSARQLCESGQPLLKAA